MKFRTMKFDHVVGDQPIMNNQSTGIQFCLAIKRDTENRAIGLEVVKNSIGQDEGYDSLAELLDDMLKDVQPESVKNVFHIDRICGRIAVKSRRGMGRVYVLNRNKFYIVYGSATSVFDRPVLRHYDSNGNAKYTAHPGFHAMVVPINRPKFKGF